VVREDQSPEERDEAMLEIIESQEDAYQRAIELVTFYSRKDDRSKVLTYIDEALEHFVAKDTPAARNATTAHHRALLQAKLGAAAALGDEEGLAAARDDAARFNVDGAGGRSILGLYHMHLKEYELAIMAFREAVEIQPTDARSLTRLGHGRAIAHSVGAMPADHRADRGGARCVRAGA
jgi:tetratricopeptide (TPR) repeat protein